MPNLSILYGNMQLDPYQISIAGNYTKLIPQIQKKWNQNTISYPKTGKRGYPQVFPHKLKKCLDEYVFKNLEWSHNGEYIIIKNKEKLEKELSGSILSISLASFQRQLNLYGFTRYRKIPSTYFNPNFKQSDKEVHITRESIKHSKCKKRKRSVVVAKVSTVVTFPTVQIVDTVATVATIPIVDTVVLNINELDPFGLNIDHNKLEIEFGHLLVD